MSRRTSQTGRETALGWVVRALIILIGVSTAASSAFAAAPLETLDIEPNDRISKSIVEAR